MPLATILKNREVFAGKRVGVIITGGNVDLTNCPGCKAEEEQTMNDMNQSRRLEVGYDVPAASAWTRRTSRHPAWCWIWTRWSGTSRRWATSPRRTGMRHRVHGKMHKSVDVAMLQEKLGGAAACAARRSRRPKSSPAAASRMCWCPTRCATRPRSTAWPVCPSWAPRHLLRRRHRQRGRPVGGGQKHGTRSSAWLRSTAAPAAAVCTTTRVVAIAKAIDAADGLKFAGIQAYQGAMQHMDCYEDRKAKTRDRHRQVATPSRR